MNLASLISGCVNRKPGWYTSEFSGSVGTVGTILMIAQLNQPVVIRVVAIVAVALVGFGYAGFRTFLKGQSATPFIQGPSPDVLGQQLSSLYELPDAIGVPTKQATEPKQADPARAAKS